MKIFFQLTGLFVLLTALGCHAQSQEIGEIDKVEKSEQEWRSQLTEEEFYILRESGTEGAYTGKYNKHDNEGLYRCAACHNPLFSSKTKFDSGTGWPSFYQPVDPIHVKEKKDYSYNMVRTEVVCAQCGGHLGHVFEDGPKPTQLRYCINSIALNFEERSVKELQ